MTSIGKTLVFVVLVFGVGVAVLSAATYTQRPTWFKQPGEGGIDKGNTPLYFSELKKEIDALGNAAVAAGSAWGANKRQLEAAEALRAARAAQMFGVKNPDGTTRTKGLLDFAREGRQKAGMPEVDAPGFFNLKEDPATKLLDLNNTAETIQGPDKLPLRGADQLLARINADAKAGVELAEKSQKLRAQQKQLSADIALLDTRVAKQRTIRDHQLNEAAYLAAFEVNVNEQRKIATRRQAQLIDELKKFGGP